MLDKLFTLLLVVFAVIHYTKASTAGCPAVEKVQPNFNLKEFLGHWYQYASTFNYFENGLNCIQTDYIENSNRTITAIDSGKMSGVSANSIAHLTAESLPGSFSYEEGGATAPYWVLATDYNNYAVTCSCSQGQFMYWILTREPSISSRDKLLAYAALQSKNFSPSQLIETVQNC